MNRVERVYHPEAIAARAELRRRLEADLPIVTPVWVAGPGGAAMQATPAAGGGKATTHGTAARTVTPNPPKFSSDLAEVAWWQALHEKERRDA